MTGSWRVGGLAFWTWGLVLQASSWGGEGVIIFVLPEVGGLNFEAPREPD